MKTRTIPRPFLNLNPRALATALSLIVVASVHAQTRSWIGNTTTDWATAANWDVLPASGNSLQFGAAGSQGTSLTNTLTSSAFNIGSITFDAGAPAYTMTGNTFNLSGATAITNNSGNIQTLSFTGGILTNATTQAFDLTGAGVNITTGLILNRTAAQTLTVNGVGNTLTLGSLNLSGSGASARVHTITGSGNVDIQGVVQATTATAGYNFVGNGTLTLGGANTYTGVTTLGSGTASGSPTSSGTLVLKNSLALQNSTLNRTSTASADNLTTVVFDSSVATHAFTFGGLSGGSSTAGSRTTLTLTDNAANAVALTIGNNNANVTYSGIIAGTGSLLKVGTGTQTLSGANTFSGGLTIRSGGVVSTTFTQALGGNTGLVTLGDALTNSNVTLQPQMAGQTFANPISVGNASNGNTYVSTLQFGAGGGGTFAGAIQLNSHDLTVNTGANSSAVTYSGTSTGTSGFAAGINGTGNLILNTVGATAFTVSNATGNKINNIGTVTHTGAGTGTVTIAAPIGSNVQSLTQNSASSNLILSGSNAYTGDTNVTLGTLVLASSGSITNSANVNINAGATFDTTAQSFTMLGGQEFVFTLDPAAAGSAGLLNAGVLNITSGVVDFVALGPLDDAVYVIANYTSLTGAAFATVNSLPSGYTLDYAYNGGTQIALVVPEPSTSLLAGLGLMVVLSRMRRSRV